MIRALARLDIAIAHAMLGPTERDRLGRRVTELASSRSRMVDATEHERRRAMMEQMRASATPQMLQMMADDPMWQMLDSGEMIRMMEEAEADMDRMLGRP